MKVKFLAYAECPDRYMIDSESIIAHIGDTTETYDLSPMPEGAELTEAAPINGVPAIIAATRIDGELHVTLCQRAIAGHYPNRKAHWRDGPVIDAADYDPDVCYVTPTGMAGVEDYEIVRGVDVAGVEGWTVRQVVTEEAA